MYKFRTMKIDTPSVATHLLNNSEQFLTPIGTFLRKCSLDEIPQLFSILKGDMSFVKRLNIKRQCYKETRKAGGKKDRGRKGGGQRSEIGGKKDGGRKSGKAEVGRRRSEDRDLEILFN